MDDPTGTRGSRVVKQADEGRATADETRHGPASEEKPRPADLEKRGGEVGAFVVESAEDREQHCAEHVVEHGTGKRSPGQGDAVDAKQPHGDELAEDETVRLHHHEGQQGAEEYPPPEAQQGSHARRFPAETISDSGQEGVAQNQPNGIGCQTADDQRPDTPVNPRPSDGSHEPNELRAEIYRRQSPEGEPSRQREKTGGVESGNHGAQGSNRDEGGQLRLLVEGRHGCRKDGGDQAQRKSSNDLDRPGRVQVPRIVTALVLHDAGADADVREHGDTLDEDVDERHHPEGLGVEQSPQNQIAKQAECLTTAVAYKRPDRAPRHPGTEGVGALDLSLWTRHFIAGRRGGNIRAGGRNLFSIHVACFSLSEMPAGTPRVHCKSHADRGVLRITQARSRTKWEREPSDFGAPMRSRSQRPLRPVGRGRCPLRRLAVLLGIAGLPIPSALASPAGTVSVQVLPDEPGQIIDGFGTCLSGSDADSAWFQSLFLDDLRCSILRIDLTPHFVPPYSDDDYNSPSTHDTAGGPGPDGNYVRTYTRPSDYGRSYAGRSAKIAVMGPDIEQNLRLFDFSHPAWKTAGQLAQRGLAKKSELGDFKLVGSVWSPAPWLKVASGNSIAEQNGPQHPKAGTPWPFIWAGNFAGGRFDASGIPRREFDDSTLGGKGPTSALVQFARGLAAEVRGFERTYHVELHFETYYNSCNYPRAADYVAALKAVRREFDKYPDLAHVLIMGPEDLLGDVHGLWQLGGNAKPTHKNLQYLSVVAADPEASAALAFFAIHGYAADGITSAGASPDLWRLWAEGWRERPKAGVPDRVGGFRSYGKKSWMTETSGEAATWLAPASGFPGEGALGLALRIHQALTVGQQSAWIYWQLSDGRSVSDMTLTDAGLGSDSAKYAAAKHFFTLIRPGAQRVETRVSGTQTMLASAYLHPAAGTLVLVLINLDPADKTVAVDVPPFPRRIPSFRVWTSANQRYWQSSVAAVEQGRASLLLPGYGIATLVGAGEVWAGDPLRPSLASTPGAKPGPGNRLCLTAGWAGGLALAAAIVAAAALILHRRRRKSPSRGEPQA